MDNFNFNLLKYFYYIALYNGFTNASRNLSVAQPSLSLNIKKLEEELGYKLIERNSKQFVLTEEGNNLYQNLKPFFENIEQKLNFKPSNQKYQEINIGIRYSYSFLLSPDLIKKIIKQIPYVKINIKLYSKLDLNKLKEKSYDIVIDDVDYLNLLENAKIELISRVKNYFVCDENIYPIYEDISAISDLDQAKLISYNPSRKQGKISKLCYENNISFIDIISVNESDLFFNYINSGFGIGITNELYLRKYLNLKKINIKEELFEDEIGISYLDKNEIISNVIELIKNNVKEKL